MGEHMTINSNQYLQLNDYLTQVINVSGKNGIPSITQTLIAEKLRVDSSGVSKFLNGKTQKPATMMTNFVATYPLEFNKWPKTANTIRRFLTSNDALYFLNPQQPIIPRITATPRLPVTSVPVAPAPHPWQLRARPVPTTLAPAPIRAATGVDRYFRRFKEGDTTIPEAAVQKSISTLLDETEALVVNDLLSTLRASDEHQARIRELNTQPRLAGSFNSGKIIHDNESSSPFEQMAAISDWLAQKKIKGNHTFFLSAPGGDHIPVYIKKQDGRDTTTMHVMLGSKTGSHKAPRYEDWSDTDPWDNGVQKRFVYPLEALEIVRQPNFSAATVLKGNAFETHCIDTAHRYGSIYACVEDKGQSKNTAKKIRSAGLNACTFADIFSDTADPTADEADIFLPINYEDYAEEGYLDALDVSVTPGKLMKAAEKVLINNLDDGDLMRQLENLTIAKLGVVRTPLLSEHIAKKLTTNNAADK